MVYNKGTVAYYGGLLAEGKKLHRTMEGIKDDPLQMGGDFTMDVKQRKMVMLHRSKTPSDRPSVENILKGE
jgi:hypothetical protein